ncbi:SipW-dependent-type signal peptide-containing protein [Spirosoma horti]
MALVALVVSTNTLAYFSA